jgi:hypothetical protein
VFGGVLLGFAFLAKMLQAFLVVPGFAVAYLWAGPPRLGKRIWQTVLMGVGIIVGAGWWILAAQLTPAADRPYFGGSTDNNILQLAIGYNGLGRLDGRRDRSIGGGGAGRRQFGGATGMLRLFHSEFGGQISWLLPAALISLVAMLWVSRRAVRTDRTRAAALLWGGWVLVTGLVFSYMSGIIHPYYMVALAPGIAALVGIGATALWQARLGWPGASRPRPAVLATAVWSYVLLDRTPDWLPWLRWVIVIAGVPPRRGARGSLAVPAGVAFRRDWCCAGGARHGRGAGRADRLRAGHGELGPHRRDPERGPSLRRVRRRARRARRVCWRPGGTVRAPGRGYPSRRVGARRVRGRSVRRIERDRPGTGAPAVSAARGARVVVWAARVAPVVRVAPAASAGGRAAAHAP